jgi:Ca-activated chloride channel homolog
MASPPTDGGGKGEEKMVKQSRTREAILDFAELAAKAFFGGLGVAVAMALAILALSPFAQASGLPDDAKTGTLWLQQADGRAALAPKVSTEVGIDVTGMVARTRVSQVFHNPASDFVEGVYVFPLPESAAVDHLWMRIGDRVIEGQIQEKAAARLTYEKAKAEGRKAALVEQQRPNLFTNHVAHIGPGERVEIRIEYQQPLKYENGEYRLRFPLAATPRYLTPMAVLDPMPDEPKALEARTGEEPLLQPAFLSRPSNPVDIVVVIDAGVPVEDVRSSYHDTSVEKQGSRRTAIFLAREQDEADRDFELTWRVAAAAPQAAVFVDRRAQTDYALLMVVPPLPGAEEANAHRRMPREVVLVIDTSGSMEGASMQQAKEALAMALDTLTARDRFNVVEFNSITRPLFPEALTATADNVQRAKEWVRALQAGGGTEMAPALTFALDGRDTPGYLRQVIFMTDGGVANEEALFQLITQRLGSSRLFTVGIGSAPNGHFMTKAAQFGRGTFTYVGDVREVREKMTQLFEKIESPVLRDVSIRWPDGTPVETFPAKVPDLYLGEPLVVSAAATAPLGTIVVSGLRGNQPWSVALTPAIDSEHAGVGALWARAKIASLMDALARGADVNDIRPRVVQVALEHHLVSAYTSLVAVDVTPTGPIDPVRVAMVGSTLPAGMSLPQTDTPARWQFAMGMLALLLAGMVMLMARMSAARIA